MGRLILTDTAVKCVRRQAHSPHKVSACDVLRFPFHIELSEFRPVDRDRFSACVLALCLSNLDFNAVYIKLRESSKHGKYIIFRRYVGADEFFVSN